MPDFDVVVVGSGASGGWACKRLAEAGLKVALVDAGRPQSDANFTEHKPIFKLKYREKAYHLNPRGEYQPDWTADPQREPYSTAPGMPFEWTNRARITGGRTNLWGRHSYRFSDLDFKAASHDGEGQDWPLSYADLEKYYALVEDYIGVTGMPEGLPQLPDGIFQPPMGLTCGETKLRTHTKDKLGWTVTQGRLANLTRPKHGRAPCHYCGPCYRGCMTHSYFNSAFTTVADAVASGNCTHIPNAMVYQVLMDPATRRAQGVVYVDRNTHEVQRVKGRAVVLCAQALESVRVLFNSEDNIGGGRYAGGLGNSSGVMGHYLMDHIWVGGGADGEFPEFPVRPNLNGPNRPGGLYVARFQNLLGQRREKDFLRGFGFQTWGDAPQPQFGASGFGAAYQRSLMQPQPERIQLKGFGECLPNWENYVEIDPQVEDAFGIPVLRLHMKFRDNEHAQMEAMATTAVQMMEAAGAKNVKPFVVHDRRPGLGIHEVGVCRMGTDPKKSVLNQFQQTHDVRNLFVMDGAGFPSSACQNPTLTIMALAVRSCDYLMAEMKRGTV